ncbi:MAG: DPP IV N-terminal domain-containing protein, partial [Acidimicrobiales bacterium]
MPKRPFRAEDLYALKTVGDLDLSPDGRRVAFVLAEVDEGADKMSSSIWVVASDASTPPRRFSEGPADTNPRFSPDGRFLAYVSAPADKPREARVLLAPLDGGAPRPLGDLPGPASQIAWSPDAACLAVICRVGLRDPEKASAKERNAPRVVRGLAARFNGLGWRDGRAHIYLVEVGSGRCRQLTRGDFDHADPSFSPDGSTVAFVADRSPGHDDREWHRAVYVVPAGGGRPRRLTETKGSAVCPSFSPDGKLIAYAGTDVEVWEAENHVFVVPADGSRSPERVAVRTDRVVASRLPGMPPTCAWSGGNSLLMLLVDRGGIALHQARLDSQASREVVGGSIEIDFLAARPGLRTAAFAAAWADRPWEVFAVRPGSGEPLQLTHFHDELLEAVELVPVDRASIRRPDGTEVEYFTMLPPGRAGKRRPTAGQRLPKGRLPVHVDIHGGPHGWNPIAWGLALYQTIAAAGYALLLPNPR